MYTITQYRSDDSSGPGGNFGLVGSLIAVIFGIVIVILGLRFLFLFLGANPRVPFTMWIYQTSRPLVAPFYGIFASTTIPSTSGTVAVIKSTFDPITLIAMAVYAVIGAVITTTIGRRLP
jgi:hypothetical protein